MIHCHQFFNGDEHALEFDLTQRDSDSEVVIVSCSDTEKCVEEPPPQRRLRLLWDPSVPTPAFSGIRRPEWWKGLFRTLAARIGSVPAGSEIPRAVRSLLWSPINVPLIWSASGSADSTPALDWLITAAGRIVDPINLYEGRMPMRDAARTGWLALRQVLRAWYIEEPDHLTGWLRTQCFPGTNPGNHISARAQEFIFGEPSAPTHEWFEGVYVQLEIHMGCELAVPHLTPSPPLVVGPRATAGFDWSLLDEFQIDERFLLRVPMLDLFFLRGRCAIGDPHGLRVAEASWFTGPTDLRLEGGRSWCWRPRNTKFLRHHGGSGQGKLIANTEAKQRKRVSSAVKFRVPGRKSHVESTLNELRNRRTQEQLREIPDDVLWFSQPHRCSWTVRCLRKV